MANEIEILVLRDSDGNTYALNAEMVRAAKVPADKVATLQQELGDTAGFFFNTNLFTNIAPQTNLANLNQTQNQGASNVAAGLFTAVGAQTAQNVGVQSGGIAQSNA
jgi:hypothetical protein